MLLNILEMNFKDKNLVHNIKVQFITFISTLIRSLQTKRIIQVFEDVHHESIQLHITDTRQLVSTDLAQCEIFLCKIMLREF